MKKKSPTEKIEGDPLARQGERAYIKIPGIFIDTTKKSTRNSTEEDYSLVEQELRKSGRKQYSHVHTHPIPTKTYNNGMGSIPSDGDLFSFLLDNRQKTTIIAQQNPESGKVEGYYFFRKTKHTPQSSIKDYSKVYVEAQQNQEETWNKYYNSNPFFKQVGDDVLSYRAKAFGRYFSGSKPPSQRQEAIDEISKKYGIQSRYVPAKGYEYEKGTKFSEKKLEKLIETTSIVSLGFSLLISMGAITGNVIGAINSSKLINTLLFILGTVSGLVYIKNRKKI